MFLMLFQHLDLFFAISGIYTVPLPNSWDALPATQTHLLVSVASEGGLSQLAFLPNFGILSDFPASCLFCLLKCFPSFFPQLSVKLFSCLIGFMNASPVSLLASPWCCLCFLSPTAFPLNTHGFLCFISLLLVVLVHTRVLSFALVPPMLLKPLSPLLGISSASSLFQVILCLSSVSGASTVALLSSTTPSPQVFLLPFFFSPWGPTYFSRLSFLSGSCMFSQCCFSSLLSRVSHQTLFLLYHVVLQQLLISPPCCFACFMKLTFTTNDVAVLSSLSFLPLLFLGATPVLLFSPPLPPLGFVLFMQPLPFNPWLKPLT